MNDKDEFTNTDRVYSSIITFQHLRYAIAAADHGSFRRAAESLPVRQSTLSRCVRQLENAIGLTIFERSSGGVHATKAGINFLRVSRSILEQVASLVESARRAADGKAGQLAIGFGTSLSTGNLRDTIIDHIHRFPQIEIDLFESCQTRLVAATLNGEIDVAILSSEQEFPDCRSMPLGSENILVALPPGHRLAAQKAVYWADLRSETFVLGQDDSGRGLEGLEFPHPGPPDYRAKIKHHKVSRGTIHNLVGMGLGVSLVNESEIGASISGAVYRQMREATGPCRIDYSAYWRGDNENPALMGFLKLLAARHPLAAPDLSE